MLLCCHATPTATCTKTPVFLAAGALVPASAHDFSSNRTHHTVNCAHSGFRANSPPACAHAGCNSALQHIHTRDGLAAEPGSDTCDDFSSPEQIC
eukprot:1270451-Amphidinium_carterae.1